MVIRKAPNQQSNAARVKRPGLRSGPTPTPAKTEAPQKVADTPPVTKAQELQQSGMAAHALAEGLVKAKDAISETDAAKTKKQIAVLTVEARGGGAATRRELQPEFRAAKKVGQQLADQQLANLEENRPELKAAYDAVAPEITEMAKKTAMELRKNPEAMARVQNVVAHVGKEGFAEAVGKVAPDVGEAFSQATGVQMMNEPVVRGALEQLPKLAQKVAPQHAAKVASCCATAGKKLGLEVAEQAAEGAAKAVAKDVAKDVAKKAATEVAGEAAEAVAKTVAKEAAGEAAEAVAKSVAKTAGKEVAEAGAKAGAKAAVKGTAAAGKAVPVVGNVIAVGSTCLAAVGLVKELFKKPADGERVAKEGINTLLQGVGIAFPWAALGGDIVDLGWSTKLAVSDAKKKGASPAEQKMAAEKAKKKSAPLGEVAGVAAEPARALASALDGAGKPGASLAFKNLAKAADDLGKANTPQARADFKREQTKAFSQLASLSSTELEKLAGEANTPGERDALQNLSHGFGELFGLLYAERKSKGDEKTREDRGAKLMGVLTDVTRSAAALATEGKGGAGGSTS
jgi:hypothetical protein